MFRAGKEKRNLKPQGREDSDAAVGMGQSRAELHSLQLGGKSAIFPMKQELLLHGAVQLNTLFQGKKSHRNT